MLLLLAMQQPDVAEVHLLNVSLVLHVAVSLHGSLRLVTPSC